MKKLISSAIFAIFLAIGVLSFAITASAEELKMVGPINKIEMAADGNSAVAVLKDSKSGAEVPILITEN